MVQVKGLEPPRRKALDPKSSASANFATPATSGVPGGIRTPDTRLRRAMLYPAELLRRFALFKEQINYILKQIIIQ